MCKCFTDKSYLGGGYSYAGNKLVWSLVISSLFIVVSSFSALSCVILGYLNGEIIAKNYFSYTMTWFYLLICDIMQTHKKKSNRSPNHVLPSLPDEAIQLAVVEHLPYRTSHVVCISWLSTLYHLASFIDSGFFFPMQVQELYDEAGFWGFWKGVIPTLIMVSRK
ncbi:hypothetical protein BHE74_00000562 [Ensete ventricosum]|nr:hypothetical protein BHE74_00000562 [Ensete ventricosum]